MLVHLNGLDLPHADARIPVDDRGFLFADGLYEVVRVYNGRPFLLEPHMARMREGLAALRMDPALADGVPAIADRLLDANGLRAGDATIYVQVTRGAAPRRHAFPDAGTAPTLFVATKPFRQHPPAFWDDGVDAIMVPDTRWSRCDIKSIALLPNVLANQAAKEGGAFEAVFVRDGVLIEGSHSNLFAVMDGRVVTYPACNYILAGVTRAVVLDLARRVGLPATEGPIHADRLGHVSELFLTGTTTEVMPVTRLDGRPVGDGRPGPVARRLQLAYREHTDAGRTAGVA
jgi:D-alanine transaminase